MKYSITLVLFLYTLTCLSQVKKVVAKQPVKSKVSEVALPGPLREDDYKYYFLANRNSSNENEFNRENYSLKRSNEYFGKINDFSNEWVIIDVRTGKEVAFWPQNVQNFYSKKNRQIYAYDNKKGNSFSLMYGFDSTGKFLYKELMSTHDSTPFGVRNFSLSTDFKKGVFSFNNDLWVGNFDITKGKLSAPVQSTFNGLMDNSYFYMKGDNVLAVGSGFGSETRLVNVKTGKIKDLSLVADINDYITDYLYNGSFDGAQYGKGGLISMNTHAVIPNKEEGYFKFWLDDRQTKYLWSGLKPDVNKILQVNSYYLYNLNKTGDTQTLDTSPVRLHWPNAVSNTLDYYRLSFSKKKKFFLNSYGNHVYLYDLDNNFKETELNLGVNFYYDKATWVDDKSFIFNAKPGDAVTGERITAGTQGTYIFNVETGLARRITPYLTNDTGDSFHLDKFLHTIVSLPEAGYVVFVANNILFRVKIDGTELTPLIKYPGLYSLRTQFLSESFDLE